MKAVVQFSPQWLSRLRARANVPPHRQRVDLMVDGEAIGSVALGVMDEIAFKSPSIMDSLLHKVKQTSNREGGIFWQIDGPLSQVLNQIALDLREGNLEPDAGDSVQEAARHVNHHWRNEQLAVLGADGQVLGSVERGAVRALGIATRAVHLVGQTPDGRYWVQQRALDKANDPGLWDTLMGGMVSAQDTMETALVRETWEEAGLHLSALFNVRHGGAITVRRPTGDDAIGYMVETTDWFRCTVPDGLAPVNQDGEVAQFELLDTPTLVARLENDAFTLEAALILVAALTS